MASPQARPGGAYVVAQVGLLGALAFEARRPRRGLPRALGVTAMLAGGALMAVASSMLGRRLRADPTPPDDAVLRTDGAYGVVRHPIYTGLLLCAGGLAMLAWSVRALALWGALLVVLTRKTGLEERLLIARFPEYQAFMARTPRFVPRWLGMLRRW